MQKILITLEDQGGAFIRWNTKEVVPTLRESLHGHPPIVVMEDEGTNCTGIKSESRNDNG